MPGVNVGTVSWKAFRFSGRRKRSCLVIKQVGGARTLIGCSGGRTSFRVPEPRVLAICGLESRPLVAVTLGF